MPIQPERVLVVAGKHEELITSGASMTWHDLVLYLVGRYAGATAAQAMARLFALQWHQDGLAPYIVFEGPTTTAMRKSEEAQEWLGAHFSVAIRLRRWCVRPASPSAPSSDASPRDRT